VPGRFRGLGRERCSPDGTAEHPPREYLPDGAPSARNARSAGESSTPAQGLAFALPWSLPWFE
jgi:hypothetical protein